MQITSNSLNVQIYISIAVNFIFNGNHYCVLVKKAFPRCAMNCERHCSYIKHNCCSEVGISRVFYGTTLLSLSNPSHFNLTAKLYLPSTSSLNVTYVTSKSSRGVANFQKYLHTEGFFFTSHVILHSRALVLSPGVT